MRQDIHDRTTSPLDLVWMIYLSLIYICGLFLALSLLQKLDLLHLKFNLFKSFKPNYVSFTMIIIIFNSQNFINIFHNFCCLSNNHAFLNSFLYMYIYVDNYSVGFGHFNHITCDHSVQIVDMR